MHFPTVDPELGDPVRTIGARTFDFSRQVAVMGIVNRTVDSFYDRGATFALEKAVDAALQAVAHGADWVDVGAVPFSPIAEKVDERAELDRLLPVVEAVRAGTDAVISVDTFRAEVARHALRAGADAVNDTSGLHDPQMARVVADAGATLVVTHSRAAPGQHSRGRTTTTWSPTSRSTCWTGPGGPSRRASGRTGSSSTPATTSTRTRCTPSS
jgi:dihydropteroate synthase